MVALMRCVLCNVLIVIAARRRSVANPLVRLSFAPH
jgi:hypothetical protein